MPRKLEGFGERRRKQQQELFGRREHNEREKRFYQRSAWKRLRAYVLRMAPYCADPFGVHAESGRPRAAEHVDHIKPLRDRPDLGLALSNLQGLCRSCHSKKTQQEGVRY